MNVNTIIIGKEEALQKLEAYKSVIQKKRLPEDDKLESLYRAVSKGARVLNLVNALSLKLLAIKQTGLNDKGEPRLAIARADWKQVFFKPRRFNNRFTNGAGHFSRFSFWQDRNSNIKIVLPENTFDNSCLVIDERMSDIPHIPPGVRPKFKLNNYHILFEVNEWKTYPVDPYLLRCIEGFLYVVEAEWSLTELEAELFSSMNQTSA